jgi:protease-4
MPNSQGSLRGISRLSNSYIFLAIVSIIIGILIFNFFIKIPDVGVITIDTRYVDEETKDEIVKMLRYAREDNSIKAVVLEMNCPGGEASKIEEIFLELLRLRSEKPVVTSIDGFGVSGGYYIAAASNFIYAKPSSEVGNIGVISVLPKSESLDEELIISGPYKYAQSKRHYASQIEMTKQYFVESIIAQRKGRLNIDKETLSRAEIYTGIEGMRYGLVDGIGTRSDAIEKAASYAGIANYGLVDINKEVSINENAPELISQHSNDTLFETNTMPANYYFYMGE